MAPTVKVTLMPKVILVATATVEARVPAAPFTPQNQGVGFRSIAEMSSMPVGNPNPNASPPGAIVAIQRTDLDNKVALS